MFINNGNVWNYFFKISTHKNTIFKFPKLKLIWSTFEVRLGLCIFKFGPHFQFNVFFFVVNDFSSLPLKISHFKFVSFQRWNAWKNEKDNSSSTSQKAPLKLCLRRKILNHQVKTLLQPWENNPKCEVLRLESWRSTRTTSLEIKQSVLWVIRKKQICRTYKPWPFRWSLSTILLTNGYKCTPMDRQQMPWKMEAVACIWDYQTSSAVEGCPLWGIQKWEGWCTDKSRKQYATGPHSAVLRCQRSYTNLWTSQTNNYYSQNDSIHRLNRMSCSIIFRLGTGHCTLWSHLHPIGVAITPTCPCGHQDRTPFHIMQHCQLFAEQRHPHLKANYGAPKANSDLQFVLLASLVLRFEHRIKLNAKA